MNDRQLQNYRFEGSNDDPWDVFIADEDEYDPEPAPGDFWPDDSLPFADDHYRESGAICGEVSPCCR